MRARLIVVLSVAALMIPAASAQAAGIFVRLKPPAKHPHHPVAGKPWKLTVTAKKKGSRKPVHGKALYKFIYNGSVVSTQYPDPNGDPAHPTRKKPWPFFGRFTDKLQFPARAVGIPLTLRVVVKGGRLGKARKDFAVRVRR